MKNNIIVSIFPTYKCNHNCHFCYLYNNHDDKVLSLDILKERLSTISEHFTIEKFNTYGGEITLLSEEYLKGLNEILRPYNRPNYITSNFYDVSKLYLFDNAMISTSLNEERQDYKHVKKILQKGVNFPELTVLSIVTPSLLNKTPSQVLKGYNGLGIKWLSFIKYYPSINTGDVFNISQKQYEDFLISVLEYYTSHRKEFDYKFSLESGLNSCIDFQYPIATNDQCIRISPEGKFGAIYYDNNNLECFRWYDDIEDYINDCAKEKIEYFSRCGTCKYYAHCWTEHITHLPCDGCKNLLEKMERIREDGL